MKKFITALCCMTFALLAAGEREDLLKEFQEETADMADTDVSFRCNIVTLSEEDCEYEDRTIIDHSSDEISTKDAAVLLESLKEGLKREGYEFYVGTSYRHLFVLLLKMP